MSLFVFQGNYRAPCGAIDRFAIKMLKDKPQNDVDELLKGGNNQ
jgi:hypothetical protein